MNLSNHMLKWDIERLCLQCYIFIERATWKRPTLLAVLIGCFICAIDYKAKFKCHFQSAMSVNKYACDFILYCRLLQHNKE